MAIDIRPEEHCRSTLIAGTVTGDVLVSNHDVTVEAGGNVDGAVTGRRITVGGRSHGRLIAREIVRVLQSAAVWADIASPKFALEDGATFTDPAAFRGDRLGDDAVAALPKNAFVPQGGGTPDGHRCAGEALIQLIVPAFLGWFTRNYDLTYPQQDASPGSGGLGPLPRSNLIVKIAKRQRVEQLAAHPQ